MPRPRLPPARLDELRQMMAAKAAVGAAIRSAAPAAPYLDPKPPRQVTVKPVPFIVVDFVLEVSHGPFPTREAADDFVRGHGLVQFLVCPLLADEPVDEDA